MGLLMEILDAAGRAIAKPNADEAEVDVLQDGESSSDALVNWSEGGKKRSTTGKVANSTLAQMTLQTVNIPQNFAGLESISTPTRLRYQLFTITSVDEQDDYVEVVASHIFYEQATNYTVWTPETLVNYSCGAICRNVMNNTINGDEGFKVATDCTEQLPWHQIDYARKNLVEVFLDPEKGICNRFNLNIVRDNMNFYVLKNVGYDRGFVIEDKKNLLGVQRQESIDNTVTRIAAYGKDKNGNILWLNNDGKKYVDSQYIANYKYPRVEIYDTGVQITGDNEAEQLHQQGRDSEIVTAENINAKIYNAAVKRFTEDHVDDPEVTMKVDFVSLGDTEEYKQYRDLDKVYLYDIVHVKHSGRDYSYGAQVIGVEHDILTGMLLSVTIGNIVTWDGIRKVANWQVPEIDGSIIRMHSITSSQYDYGSVTGYAIRDEAIAGNHLNKQSVSHALNIDELKSILAQAGLVLNDQGILIYKDTDDNMMGSRLEVQGNRIAMVIGTYQGTDYIKAGEIALAINQSTGASEAKIDANHVYIGNDKSTTVIAGKAELTDLNAATARITSIEADCLTATNISSKMSGSGLTIGGQFICNSLTVNNQAIGNANITSLVSAVQQTDGSVKFTGYRPSGASYDIGTFRRASGSVTSLEADNDSVSYGNNYNTLYVPVTAKGTNITDFTRSVTVDSSGARSAGYSAGRTYEASLYTHYGQQELFGLNTQTGQMYSVGNHDWYYK